MHILSIEDDPDTQANLCDILELDGYQVDTAGTLQNALARENWSDYSVIILDRRLPDGTAEEFLPRLRSLAPEAAIIIVTGHIDIDGTITALRYGAADYILKPINPDSLRMSLARVLKLQEVEKRVLQSERLAAIGQMIPVFAHESRNALQRIQAGIEMLRMQFSEATAANKIVDGIEQAVDDINKNFEEIRGFATPIKLKKEECDLSRIWQKAWNNLQALWKDREVTFQEQIQSDCITCSVDAFRLEQVFRNLFENSLAACPDPAQISVHCQAAHIDDGQYFQVTVCDNGQGLSDEQRARAFNPFYTTKTQGMGLGLPIVKRIIEHHGGQIEILEDTPSGTGFQITLPSQPRPRPETD
ncbi:C4-dicarboxylate transport sensor protein DctB [Gimesia panareensis]|uniref:histidine kinase n=1 Tax=Gimesia panareensis TaxID=2527978 RepID=A0A518FRI4_9PLAN|nr:hybrid sensor histidine kinase/response regulator [Gimesia panareensis]QDV18954.1 C4-dicarboxylate transport sensor protein DctB [Gimesia panareensis]